MDASGPSWSQSLEGYRDFLIASGKSAGTVKARLHHLRRFARAQPASPGQIGPEQVVRFLGNSSWSPNTRRGIRASVVSFFRWAHQTGAVPKDPTTALPPLPVPRSVPRPATRKAVNQALKNAEPRTALMIRLSADAGLSAMEIATCRQRDLEQHDGDYILRVLGKAGGIRLVPVPTPLADEILSSPGEYLFAGRIDGHISPAYVVKLISRALPTGVTSEQLRQAFVTSATGRRVQSWRHGGPYHSPDESTLLEHAALADSKTLHQHLRRIARDIDRDPAAAISECKNLLEGLFKQVLTDREVEFTERDSMPSLYGKVAQTLCLETDSVNEHLKGSAAVATAVQGLASTVLGITQTRNAVGTGHGQRDISPAEPRHARLAFNATVAVAEFLVQTWQSTRSPAVVTREVVNGG